MANEAIAGIPIEKIREIDKRANNTRRKTNKNPLKIDMSMDELTKLLLNTEKKEIIK
jgi:hypothetical protein